MGGQLDAVVVGSGPNGLAAAIELARSGYSVKVLEAAPEPGGGARSAELTEPGFVHDICSSVHPMGAASPFFRSLELEKHGLEWVEPPLAVAHPLDGGEAAILSRSVEETAAQFDRSTGRAYRRLFGPLLPDFEGLLGDLLAPPKLPKHPLAAVRFGLRALPSSLAAARAWFSDEKARALLAGNAAHAVLPLDAPLATNAVGLMLMLAGHRVGWPFIKGGSRRLTEVLVQVFRQAGGSVETGFHVRQFRELPPAKVVLFDTAPGHLAEIAEDHLPGDFRRRLRRYRHGAGVFKIDFALSGPIPWTNPDCSRAGTVHLGGSLDEIVRAEREVAEGRHPEQPFVLAAQPSQFDPTRAPEGKQTFWAYCHVPAGSEVDRTEAIERQIERFAPGFRDLVIARHRMNCRDFERHNPNLIGGDIIGGMSDWRQLLTRPVARLRPHTTPIPRIFLASASTPPGAGVHGMCGYWAAREAIRYLATGRR